MGLLGVRRKKQPLSRRELVASRRYATNEQPAQSTQSFRRSRTINTRSHSSDTVSVRQSAHDLRAKRRKIMSWLGGSLLLIGGVVALLYQLTATVIIETPDRRALSSDDEDRYQAVLTEYFETRPLERLRFALDKSALQTHFLTYAPEVQSVDVIYGGGVATSALRLSFRQPALQWVAGGSRYYVDGMGVTFERNYFNQPPINVEDKSGVEPEVGQAVVNRRFLSFLGQAAAAFEASGVKVSQAVLPDSTVRQVEFGIEGKGYVVKMTVDRGVEEQVARATHAMEYFASSGIAPTYIDARIDQRIFYR